MYYKRTKFGNFMYDITMKGGLFLSRHMWLYFILNFTWGIIMTLLGYIIAFILLLCRRIPYKYQTTFYFKIGKSWGGLELGMIFIRDKESNNTIEPHEYGHSFQNALYGPLAIFIIFIPSFIRYWYQEFRNKKHKKNKPYDSIWFEGSATDIGETLEKRRQNGL